jgi:uncharacterized protein
MPTTPVAIGPKPLRVASAASGFVFKVAERCNLNCSYCYMYNKGDSSFRSRPRFMSLETAAVALRRIADHAHRHELDGISVALHGGEPLLVGRPWVEEFLHEARRVCHAVDVDVDFAVQTNGVLLDDRWLDLLGRFEVQIGVSCDGPQQLHDAARVDRNGRGSYRRTRRAIELLADRYAARWGVLTVVNYPEASAGLILDHFVQLGVYKVDFLWPDFHHDDPPPWPSGTLARFYCELFDTWYAMPDPPRVRWLETAIALLLGGDSMMDALGPQPLTDVMVESDGSWEPLDVLRTCGDGMTRTGLDARVDEVDAILSVPLYRLGLRNQELLSAQCQGCWFRHVCGGGYMPHRFSRASGFSNPSVHCADLYAVLAHIRERLLTDLEPLASATNR